MGNKKYGCNDISNNDFRSKKVTTELLNKWVQEVDYYCLMDVLMTAICT